MSDALPSPRVTAEEVWFCSKDGVNYVSPRCGQGGTHRQVTVTTTVVVTEGWGEKGEIHRRLRTALDNTPSVELLSGLAEDSAYIISIWERYGIVVELAGENDVR